MDPRIREHAEIIVEHSLHIEAGDDVVVAAPSVAEDLEVAVYELLADLGANPVSATSPLEGRTNPRAGRAYLKNRDTFETPAHHQALFEAADAFLIVRAFENVAETADVDPQVLAAASKANRPVQEERLSKRWCLTQFPAVGNAQLAEMSTEAYENFVWDAVIRDWDEQREHQEGMVEILDAADEVRIVSGENTDLTMSLAGNRTLNDYGEKNLPGGEVFTAPVPDSVEGEVHFDLPLYHNGREVTDVVLRFEGGEVVAHSAAKNEEVLNAVLDTDDGARRLGELGGAELAAAELPRRRGQGGGLVRNQKGLSRWFAAEGGALGVGSAGPRRHSTPDHGAHDRGQAARVCRQGGIICRAKSRHACNCHTISEIMVTRFPQETAIEGRGGLAGAAQQSEGQFGILRSVPHVEGRAA